MKIKFWGTRGSIPSPSADTVKYGGNTSCVEISLNNGTLLIIDAGTGIRYLGLDIFKRTPPITEIHLFISHAHWDHIQGFPFFGPAYSPNFKLSVYCAKDIENILKYQMNFPFFPISLEQMGSKKEFFSLIDQEININGAKIRSFMLYHPQDVYGFRIEYEKKVFVYASDTEHRNGTIDLSLCEQAKMADYFLYDAQYTPEEYKNGKVGWGHSTYEEGSKIAQTANAKNLILFHHDPTHTDKQLDDIETNSKKLFANSICAREGLEIVV